MRVPKTPRTSAVAVDISRAILVLRGQRALLDLQLATLYGASTKALNQAAKRNQERFPEDFLFRLTRAETEALNRSQIGDGLRISVEGMAITGHGGSHANERGCPEQQRVGIGTAIRASRLTPLPSTAPSWPPPS